MKLIDAHIHFSNINSFKDISKVSHVDYSLDGFKQEFEGIIAIGMGVTELHESFPDSKAQNPMTLDLDQNPGNLYHCLGFNPHQEINIDTIKKHITPKTAGFKIYAGYYHYYVWDAIYHPIYKLAEEYDLPVVIHTGDTFSEKGLLKYAHPLEIDELAVSFPNVRFIIAHFGDPWIMDAAEVAAKNKNVYIDLSGLIIGDQQEINHFLVPEYITHIKRGMIYLDNYKKLLFGTDWPLVKVKPYVEFIKKLVPKEHHADVFYNNAKRVFKLKEVE